MLNLLRRISCFMSSPEKPYVVDNSALTGREAASVSRIPGRAVWVHLAHPIWVSRTASGLIAMKVIVSPQLVHPTLPQVRVRAAVLTWWVLVLDSGSRLPRTVQVAGR